MLACDLFVIQGSSVVLFYVRLDNKWMGQEELLIEKSRVTFWHFENKSISYETMETITKEEQTKEY